MESGPEGWRWARKPLGLLLARSSDHLRLVNHLWHLLSPESELLLLATGAGPKVLQAEMLEHVEFF